MVSQMLTGGVMRIAALAMVVLSLSGCAQQFVGAAYKVSVGRQVTEFFQDTSTAWQAGAEFRFDVKR
jgi:hypothetical protein